MSLRPHLRRVAAFCVCRYWVVTRLVTGCVQPRPCVRVTCVRWLDAAWGVTICRIICLLRGCVALAYGLVSLGLHCFLRLAHALYCHSRRCLASVACSVQHGNGVQCTHAIRAGAAAVWCPLSISEHTSSYMRKLRQVPPHRGNTMKFWVHLRAVNMHRCRVTNALVSNSAFDRAACGF